MARRVEFEVDLTKSRSGNCRSCDAAVEWIKTPRGKWMPLDVASQRRADGKVYMESHHAHCPDAEDWRKRGG